MKGRSVRLSSEDEAIERQVFEAYGIAGVNFSEEYRAFLRFLHENLSKNTPTPPPAKFDKPDCKHLTEPLPAQFHCVHRRANAPPQIKVVHLIDCASCKLQEHNISNTPVVVLSEPVKEGELPPAEETVNENAVPVETFEPIKGYKKILNYVRPDGAKICPFEHNERLAFVYHFNCVLCQKNNNAKYSACLTLRSTVQSQIKTQNVTHP